ncbi:MAG TPA: protein-disulfide reductase DsbD domain-containing protein [Thermoanaerobaculia bacterium]|nr:protein-disulfide reductase DsbD domain-containing protein [Thermoanaerobaculia bacterium]
MTRLGALVGALLLLHAPVVAAQVHEGKTIVTARLVADTVRVQPGSTFTLGVHLTVAPGWHVYWENPGDTALPIQVEWQLPAGLTTSALRWPEPERYQEQGGVTVFGYERETLLLTTVSVPRAIPGESLTLQARADWLVCEKLCIPGDAALELTLPVGKIEASDDMATIRRFAARVPSAGSGSGIRITQARARKETDRWFFSLDLDVSGRRILRFFPRTIEGFAIDHGRITVKGARVEFSAQLDEPGLTARRISGVVATDRGSFDVSAEVALTPVAAAVLPATDTGPAEPPRPVEGSVEEVPLAVAPPPAAANSTDDWLSEEFTTSGTSGDLSFVKLLIFAALGGLLLNIMPCVLPVISLKLLSFAQQAGHDQRRTRVLGLMFAGGVIVSFWILVAAVAAIRATAEQVGWGFQFQSPIFVLIMSVVVLVFAMNLFGVFEISGPVLTGSVAGAGGRGGAFMHGMLATVMATPCTAPFLGTAIGFAFTQSLLILFLAFTAVGIGLALPYVVLSWHPALLSWLPRPGEWMIRFKQAMGFVLLATVVWLLSVLGAQLGPEGIVWSLVFLTVVAFAVWVVGQIPSTAGAGTRAMWRFAALGLVAGGYFWALEHELRWREPVAVAGADAPATTGIRWERFALSDLRQRVERGETVFVDFTADWCWSCKVNERTVLASSRVQERIRQLEVTAVKADWTRRNPDITRLLARFGRVGVPFYVVFPAGQLRNPIALSEMITPTSVIAALDRAGPSRKGLQPR